MVGGEEEMEYTCTAYEIDLDYEFDAARFFDFKRDESPLESRQAELWFDSAGSYPPSPFVAKLVLGEELLMGKIHVSPKSKCIESMNLPESNSDVEADREVLHMEMEYGDGGQVMGISSTVHVTSQQKFKDHSEKLPSGLTFYNRFANIVKSADETKLSMKPTFPRPSTLMRPTVSQLAKQNRPFQAGYSRSRTSVFEKTSTANTFVFESQAAKRQKLAGGILRKVIGSGQLQQANFVHKAHKQDGFLDGNSTHTKLKITIPKDPDLETAHRAQRAKSSKDEKVASTVRRFKALPLNRKILEGPSLLPKRSTPRLPDFHEFHLKTSERAMQHTSAVLKSKVPWNHSNKDLQKCRTNLTIDCGNGEPVRPSLIHNTASRPDGCQSSHSFKALALNKKILTSKGDIGMFRNIKKEATVPMEFNFHTEKRFHDNPPIELFNKLSIASDTRVTNSKAKAPQSFSISAKGSKENRWDGSFQQANEIKQPSKLRWPLIEGDPQFSNELKNEGVCSSGIRWGKSIWCNV